MIRKIAYIFILFLIPFISAGTLTLHFVDLNTMSGVGGVSVDVYNYDNNVKLLTANSDSNGYLSIPDLEGKYSLRTLKEDYSTEIITQLVNESDVDLGDYFLVPLSTVNVDISNSSDSVNSMVRIQTSYNEIIDYFEGTSGQLKVPAGSYTIVVYAPNHVPSSINVNLAPGEVQDKSIVLEYTEEILIPSVSSIDIDLDYNLVNAGDVVIYTVKALYNNGLEYDVTNCVNLNSITFGTIYGSEIVTQKVGEHTISATYLGKTDSENLIVNGGEIISSSLTASKTSIKVRDKSVLTFYLHDIYSNVFESNDFVCNSTCGNITGNNFTSKSACTANITCIYNLDNSINSSITIKVSAEESSSSSSGSKSSSSKTETTTIISNNTSSNVNLTKNESTKLSLITFILPDEVIEGDNIEIIVTDSRGNPVEGIDIIVMDPNKDKFTLSSDSNGIISFKTELFGNYFLYSEEYSIMGTRVIYVASQLPEVSDIDNSPIILNPEGIRPIENNTSEIIVEEKQTSMFDILTATISGEMSIVDALKSTIHLWILIAIILISAAVFFVVYTYVIGNSVEKTSGEPSKVEESSPQKAIEVQPVPPVSNETNIPSDLEEKLMKLRELKRKL